MENAAKLRECAMPTLVLHGGADTLVPPALGMSMLGMLLHLRGNYDEAMGRYDQALGMDPGAVDVLLKRSSLWFEKEELPKAHADFDAAIARRAGGERSPCARPEDGAAPARRPTSPPRAPKAQLAPTDAAAQPRPRGSLWRPQQPASARPRRGTSPPATGRSSTPPTPTSTATAASCTCCSRT